MDIRKGVQAALRDWFTQKLRETVLAGMAETALDRNGTTEASGLNQRPVVRGADGRVIRFSDRDFRPRRKRD